MYSARDALRRAALAGLEILESSMDENIVVPSISLPIVTATKNVFYSCGINIVAEFVQIAPKHIPEDFVDSEY